MNQGAPNAGRYTPKLAPNIPTEATVPRVGSMPPPSGRSAVAVPMPGPLDVPLSESPITGQGAQSVRATPR